MAGISEDALYPILDDLLDRSLAGAARLSALRVQSLELPGLIDAVVAAPSAPFVERAVEVVEARLVPMARDAEAIADRALADELREGLRAIGAWVRGSEADDLAGHSVALFTIEANLASRRLALEQTANRLTSATDAVFVRSASAIERSMAELDGVATWGRQVFVLALASTLVLAAAAETILANAREMASLSQVNDDEAERAAAASNSANEHIGSVATAASEASQSNEEIAQRIADAGRLAGSMQGLARSSNARAQVLDHAAKTIGAATALIDDIADQTHLLALNATIEAARAGEAGHGFAIVAQQVKALAAQTTDATADIAALVADMQRATDDAVAEIAKTSS